MTSSIQAAADKVVADHDAGATFETLSEDRKGDLDFAYGVQDAVLAQWTPRFGDIVGWKVGLTSARMQALCGVSQPIAGAILASRLLHSPARLAARDFVRLGLETEMSFRVGAAPPAGRRMDATTIRDCLDVAAASFEVIEDRAADYSRLDAASMIADNAWNAGLVLAQARPVAELGDTAAISGRLRLNDKDVDGGVTRDVGGDPLAIVAWLANALAERGRTLELGQWVMTGSVVPTRFPKAGDYYEFELDGFEPVRLQVD